MMGEQQHICLISPKNLIYDCLVWKCGSINFPDVFRVISHQSHVPAFKFRKNEIIVKGHEAPVILHVLQVKIQFQSAVQAP